MADVLIVPSDEFRRQSKRLAKKYKSLPNDFKAFQEDLKKNPFIGTDLGAGKRKIRLSVQSKNRGKRSGLRVITYNVVKTDSGYVVYLITIYDKSEYESVSDRYVDQVIKSLM